MKNWSRKRLGKEIGKLQLSGHVFRKHKTMLVLISNKVAIYIQVLGPLTKHWISSNMDSRLVITPKRYR
ncbi:hypothetical protein Sjap_017795 [Stephania japonica]|uniref:Uncharacterized protein n=1 Tax=Stephania japonica TaxID=461633 RepID=A0AAP0NKW0_9MAGN